MPSLNADGLLTNNKRLTLLPYQARPSIKREYLTDAELMQHAGSDLILD
jgi:hypothetical protein